MHSQHNGYSRDGRRLYYFGGDDSPPAPDYTPVAAASEESARLAAKLGEDQIAEGKRQYDLNAAVGKPVVDTQLEIMKQGLAQGNDYYSYMKGEQRPIEQALNIEALKTGGVQQQEEQAAKAVADVRQGSTASQNQLMRQGLRYGFSPAKMAAMGTSAAAGQGLAEATAANTARDKEKALGFAKKLDVAGLYRGLPGASTAAYGVATGAGNSAVGNNAAPGAAYLGTMGSAAGTTMQGRQIQMQGLNGVLNAQTSFANSQANQDSGMGGIGSVLGGAARLYTAFGSEASYKQNIELVGQHPLGFGLYSFEYREKYKPKWGSGRYVGVLAHELAEFMPQALSRDADGDTVVNYSMVNDMMLH